jgi:hypothetical protein
MPCGIELYDVAVVAARRNIPQVQVEAERRHAKSAPLFRLARKIPLVDISNRFRDDAGSIAVSFFQPEEHFDGVAS